MGSWVEIWSYKYLRSHAGGPQLEWRVCHAEAVYEVGASTDQQLKRLQIPPERFRRNQREFIHWSITTDETWVHHYTLLTKPLLEQSPQSCSICRKGNGCSICRIFSDVTAIILTVFYHRRILRKTFEQIKAKCIEKPLDLANMKTVIHQNNKLPHKGVFSMAKIYELYIYYTRPNFPGTPALSTKHIFVELSLLSTSEK